MPPPPSDVQLEMSPSTNTSTTESSAPDRPAASVSLGDGQRDVDVDVVQENNNTATTMDVDTTPDDSRAEVVNGVEHIRSQESSGDAQTPDADASTDENENENENTGTGTTGSEASEAATSVDGVPDSANRRDEGRSQGHGEEAEVQESDTRDSSPESQQSTPENDQSSPESDQNSPESNENAEDKEEEEPAYWADIEEDTSVPDEEEMKEIEEAANQCSSLECRSLPLISSRVDTDINR